jgi:hypothetical protein
MAGAGHFMHHPKKGGPDTPFFPCPLFIIYSNFDPKLRTKTRCFPAANFPTETLIAEHDVGIGQCNKRISLRHIFDFSL